jgi:hypothetical protein
VLVLAAVPLVDPFPLERLPWGVQVGGRRVHGRRKSDRVEHRLGPLQHRQEGVVEGDRHHPARADPHGFRERDAAVARPLEEPEVALEGARRD